MNIGEISQQLKHVLEIQNIKHDELALIAESNNYVFSDNKHVFIKVSKLHNSSALINEVTFLKTFKQSSEALLLEDVYPLQANNDLHHALFLKFIPEMSNVTIEDFSKNPKLLYEAKNFLDDIHATQGNFRILTVQTILDEIHSRCAYFLNAVTTNAQAKITSEQYTEFSELVANFAKTNSIKLQEQLNTAELVTCHGDIHLDNIVIIGDKSAKSSNGRVEFIDFESIVKAPVDWDVVDFNLIIMAQEKYPEEADFLDINFADLSTNQKLLKDLTHLKLLNSISFLFLKPFEDRTAVAFPARIKALADFLDQ